MSAPIEETLVWYSTKTDLPEVDRKNRLKWNSQLVREIPKMVGMPFHPVLIFVPREEEGVRVVPARYIPDSAVPWWSLQGTPYSASYVTHWAEVPKGPKR